MAPGWRPSCERTAPSRSRWPLRARVDFVQADAADYRGIPLDRRFRRVETSARGGAADYRPDGRRLRADARRLRPRGGGAHYEADGEAPVGDSRCRVHLLDLQSRKLAGDRAIPGRAG